MHPHRLARRALTLLALLVGVAAFVPSAATAGRPIYGVQGSTVSPGFPQAQADLEAARAAAMNAKIMRVEALWSLLEPDRKGDYDARMLAALDRVIDAAARRNLKVLLMVDSTPCWASAAPDSVRRNCRGSARTDSEVTRYPPENPQDYIDISTFLVRRYGDRLAAFEIWNEPDQVNERYWAGPNKVRRYVALTKAVYGPLKQANPNLTVLAGAFVGADGRWLEALYKQGIQGYYDALSVHFYDLTLYALKKTRAVQLRYGDTKPMWLAEFGFPSCHGHGAPPEQHVCLSRAGQRRALVDTLRRIRTVDWVKAAVIYQLQDGSGTWQFGLYDKDGRPKPALAAVRNVFAGRKVATTPLKVKLRRARGRLVINGNGSWVDVYKVTATRGKLRWRAYVRVDRAGRFKLVAPRALGTRKVSVVVTGQWSGRAKARTR